MKYGILSDVHSNLEAFHAALDCLQKQGAERYIFCGDLIGYGPDPQACIAQYLQLANAGKAISVLGNHDALFFHPQLREYFHPAALCVLDWSQPLLSQAALQSISCFPEMIQKERFAVVHGTPRDPLKEYLLEHQQYRDIYNEWQGEVLFVGHTHIPFFMTGNNAFCHSVAAVEDTCVDIQPMFRYVINPGSVGKPRDSDARACFGLWDDQENKFYFLRAAYDFTQTQQKMRAAHFPELLIQGLTWGI